MVRSFLNLVGNFLNENNKTYDNQFKFSPPVLKWGVIEMKRGP